MFFSIPSWGATCLAGRRKWPISGRHAPRKKRLESLGETHFNEGFVSKGAKRPRLQNNPLPSRSHTDRRTRRGLGRKDALRVSLFLVLVMKYLPARHVRELMCTLESDDGADAFLSGILTYRRPSPNGSTPRMIDSSVVKQSLRPVRARELPFHRSTWYY